jgi:hypothetical protein
MADRAFEPIWRRIVNATGEEFRTATGLSFTFELKGQVVRPSRTKYNLARSDFEKAWTILPTATRSQLNRIVRGPSYVVAILKDPRVQG